MITDADRKKTVDGATVRMYRMGTGDCFVVTFKSGATPTYRMMIDCGACSGSAATFAKYVDQIKKDVVGEVDALVVTHEHDDHVKAFGACEELFTEGFIAKQVWMAWCENDDDTMVKDLKKKYGARKKALAASASLLKSRVDDPVYKEVRGQQYLGGRQLKGEERFAAAVGEFRDLQMGVRDGQYIGELDGMRVVKNKLEVAKENRWYLSPGEVIEDEPGLKGVRIYVLGPPQEGKAIRKEHTNTPGESFSRNPKLMLNHLSSSDAFATAVNAFGQGSETGDFAFPFDERYFDPAGTSSTYADSENAWRTIENDWLMSAGNLALRLNQGINNLSLVLAIEFVASGRVMLFPGDAEYGSWASWHEVDWTGVERRKETVDTPLVEDLLNRTVFYKVAHHVSHNGTADRLGMEMLKHKDLAVMATLDYGVIQSRWKGTMPNWEIVSKLIRKSKGRLMVMNTAGITHETSDETLEQRIDDGRSAMSAKELEAFMEAWKEDPGEEKLWIEYHVTG